LSKLVLNRDGNEYERYGEEHNWTHICALWELPYAHALILMHNINVVHQERNVIECIVSTCMDIMGKTKDNFMARRDIADVCNSPSLELNKRGGIPRAPFCLKIKDRKTCEYEGRKNSWLKSHDYHIIMQRLLHVMLPGYLDDDIWEALAELSYFYRQLCAKEIKKDMIEKLEEIPMLIWKLEKIFPSGWFNLMQHLLIHILYEAKVGGPVQYRWMYHIEGALKYLRIMVDNKARVEGSITESFLLKEVTYFSSVYFVEEHNINVLTL
jgi:hypothetical protein